MPNATSSRPRLILMVGLPGSGKSTWLEKLGVSAISSDSIRQLLADDPTDQTLHARVFATMRYLVRHRLALGRPATYVDATHLTPEERAPYLKLAAVYGCPVEAVFFHVSVEECLERNRRRDRNVPEEAIRAMQSKLVPPAPEEGFDRITVVADCVPSGEPG